jgi:hypothetical protein
MPVMVETQVLVVEQAARVTREMPEMVVMVQMVTQIFIFYLPFLLMQVCPEVKVGAVEVLEGILPAVHTRRVLEEQKATEHLVFLLLN